LRGLRQPISVEAIFAQVSDDIRDLLVGEAANTRLSSKFVEGMSVALVAAPSVDLTLPSG
jgi:hypothetical protein